MSRIKESIGYESALPELDPQGAADKQIEHDKEQAGQQEPPPLTEEDLVLIPF